MYPMKFFPIFKQRLWGGIRLKTLFNKPIKNNDIGESWEISTIPNDISVIDNGCFKGQNLQELINLYPEEILGRHVYQHFGKKLPILIKFIDANQDLSIQVHPNDILAQERHNCSGKTEMWYIIQADEPSQLIIGFNKNISKQIYQKHLENETLLQILNYETAQSGDAFLINSGKVHAIGKGLVIAEIQQASDITYRVYDFNRKDKNGNLRELHTTQSLDAIDYQKKDDFKIDYAKVKNTTNSIVTCPYFTTNYLKLTKNFAKKLDDDSFHIYLCTKGSGIISDGKHWLSIKSGNTVLFPASLRYLHIKSTHIELLEIYL